MTPYYERGGVTVLHGDVLAMLADLPSGSVHCCVTSPPYWGLRDYGVEGQIGLERTPEEYIAKMVAVFAEVRRVLRDDGTLWVNIGDSYATGAGSGRSMGGKCFGKQNEVIDDGSYPVCQPNRMPLLGLKPKDLVGTPWMLAFALRADGWYLRQDIIWHKPNPMPESVTDRCTKAHEYIFLLSKSARYFYNADAIKEPLAATSIARLSQDVAHQLGSDRVPGKTNGRMKAVRFGGGKYGDSDTEETRTKSGNEWEPSTDKRNKRSVWTVATESFSEAHFATFPTELIKPCILAGCPAGGVVLDPFAGSLTTMQVARELDCKSIGIELNAAYIEIGLNRRLNHGVFTFTEATA